MKKPLVFTAICFQSVLVVSVVEGNTRLTNRLVRGLCSQFKAWKSTKQLQPPLKGVTAGRALDSGGACGAFRHGDCQEGESDCQPFLCTEAVVPAASQDDVESVRTMVNSADVAPGYPGSPYLNPNNPTNSTAYPCVSTDNPFNKWPNSRRRRDVNAGNSAEEDSHDDVEDAEPVPDPELQEYLKKSQKGVQKTRIIGGKDATDNLFPYAARVVFAKKYCYWDHHNKLQNDKFSKKSRAWNETKRCTGVIINKYFTMTSSYCGRWIGAYIVAWNNPDISLPIFNCSNTSVFCPQVPESVEVLRNLSDMFLYYGEFQYATGQLENRQRRHMRSVEVDCLHQTEPWLSTESFSIVENYDPLVYKSNKAFWPLLLPRVNRTVKDPRPNTPTFGQKIPEGRSFREVNGKIRALFIGWGNINAERLDWSNYLKFVRLNIITTADHACFSLLQNFAYIPKVDIGHPGKTMYMCAKFDESETNPDNSLCRGDVGGPLICESESGHERLCGILATSRLFDETSADESKRNCLTGQTLYAFMNFSTPNMHQRIYRAINSPGRTTKASIYSKPGASIQDEGETVSMQEHRLFEDIWNAQGV